MKGPVGNRSIKMPQLAARIGSEAFVILVCNVFVVFLPAPRFEGAGRTVPLRALAFTLCLRHLRISGRRRLLRDLNSVRRSRARRLCHHHREHSILLLS